MPQSLFTAQTPATVNADNANPLHVGTYLTFSEDGEVSAARWYPPTTAQSGVKAAFYRTIDSVKLSVTDVTFSGSIAGPGWVEVDFDSPIPVTTGVQYAIVIRTPRYYSATAGGSSPWPIRSVRRPRPADSTMTITPTCKWSQPRSTMVATSRMSCIPRTARLSILP
jgi:hypothetical protein